MKSSRFFSGSFREINRMESLISVVDTYDFGKLALVV